jgi:GNAT superfamily N-acetyltransferase
MAGAHREGGRRPTGALQAPLIRDATHEDAAEIARVQVESWREAYRDHLPADLLAGFSIVRRRAAWEDWLRHPESPTLVAEVSGRIVGFVGVGPSRDEKGSAELYTLYVEPAHIGTGVGRALMQAGIERMCDLGFEEATLWVLDGNERAERFYSIAGWSREDAIKLEEWGTATLREVRYRCRL